MKVLPPRKKRFTWDSAKLGEKVRIKREPEGTMGFCNQVGTITEIRNTSFGIRVEFDNPVNYKFLINLQTKVTNAFNFVPADLEYP